MLALLLAILLHGHAGPTGPTRPVRGHHPVHTCVVFGSCPVYRITPPPVY